MVRTVMPARSAQAFVQMSSARGHTSMKAAPAAAMAARRAAGKTTPAPPVRKTRGAGGPAGAAGHCA